MSKQEEAAEQIRGIIMVSAEPDLKSKKALWKLLINNDFLVGRDSSGSAREELSKFVLSHVAAGECIDPTTRVDFTQTAHLVLKDEELLPMRLGLSPAELPKARIFFASLDEDIHPKKAVRV